MWNALLYILCLKDKQLIKWGKGGGVVLIVIGILLLILLPCLGYFKGVIIGKNQSSAYGVGIIEKARLTDDPEILRGYLVNETTYSSTLKQSFDKIMEAFFDLMTVTLCVTSLMVLCMGILYMQARNLALAKQELVDEPGE